MSRDGLKPEKNRRGWRRESSRYKCEVMVREAVAAAVHAVAVLACGRAWAGVFTHLSKTVEEGNGGVWSRVTPEGFVTLCGGDTAEDLLAPRRWTADAWPSPSPLGSGGLYAAVLGLTYWTLRWLALKTLFVHFLQPGEDSLFCFHGEIFPHHTTVSFPNHESGEQKRHQCRSLCFLNHRMKNIFFRSVFPAETLSSRTESNFAVHTLFHLKCLVISKGRVLFASPSTRFMLHWLVLEAV